MKTLKSINYEKIINTLIGLIATFILACLLSEFLFNYVLIEDSVTKVIFLTQIALLAFYNVIARRKIKRNEKETDRLKHEIKHAKIFREILAGFLHKQGARISAEIRLSRSLKAETVVAAEVIRLQEENLQVLETEKKNLTAQIETMKRKERYEKVAVYPDFGKQDASIGKVVDETAPVLEKEKTKRKTRKNKEDESGNN